MDKNNNNSNALGQEALMKFQELWDQAEDLRSSMQELWDTTQDALEDLQLELREVQIQAGGWLKVLESQTSIKLQ